MGLMEVLTCLIDEGSARSDDRACGVRGARGKPPYPEGQVVQK